MRFSFLVLIATLLIVTACSEEQSGITETQNAFWENIQQHCGNAYSGTLGDATPHYSAVANAETFTLHFFNCTENLTHIALHVDDNRSRNLMLTKTGHTLRLKHDHRYENGSEEEISQYGGEAPGTGLSHRQIFWADGFTARILPQRYDNFWFLDMMNETTFAYGVHWPKEGHSIRLEFDIANPIETPPAPWGYED